MEDSNIEFGRLIIESTKDGISIRIRAFLESGKEVPLQPLDSVGDSALIAQLLTRALFAFTNLPFSYVGPDGTINWGNSSPSNSSDNGINECIYPGATE